MAFFAVWLLLFGDAGNERRPPLREPCGGYESRAAVTKVAAVTKDGKIALPPAFVPSAKKKCHNEKKCLCSHIS